MFVGTLFTGAERSKAPTCPSMMGEGDGVRWGAEYPSAAKRNEALTYATVSVTLKHMALRKKSDTREPYIM